MPSFSMVPLMGGKTPGLVRTLLLAAIALMAVVSPDTPLVAGETGRPSAQLSECIKTASNPCPDIAEVPPRTASQTPLVKRSMKITNSPEAADQSVPGPLPSAKIGQSIQISPMVATTVTTKLILRNWTYYPVYWRVAARRGGSFYFWPSSSSSYVIGAMSKVTKSISCRKGEVIGFGAQSTDGYSVWGYGLSGEYYPYCTYAPCYDYCDGKTHIADLY